MLTGLIGNEIINCYDGTHTKEQLKKWSKKKIIKCPVCGEPYEYCHGHVNVPYFRHMNKTECKFMYSEPETEEHLQGKKDLYEWIKKQPGVTNVVLEAWIPETKQRPDIKFEHNGNKYVIEYQCSPVASEYIDRHELYKVAGIHDIWICGTEKYLKENMNEKFIEQHSIGFYNPSEKLFIFNKNSEIDNFIRKTTACETHEKIKSYDDYSFYYTCPISNLTYSDDKIIPVHFMNIDFDKAIKIHDYRKVLTHKSEIDAEKYKKQLILHILNKYSKRNNIIVKNNDKIILSDQITQNNIHYLYIKYNDSIYNILKDMSYTLYLLQDKRNYFLMMKHLKLIFKNKINGKYDVNYVSFKNGECIDIQYDDYTIRNTISEMNLKISIHDYDGFKRKNYLVYEFYGYKKYKDIITDLIKYNNKIFDNNLKMQNVIARLKEYNNKNWEFNYQKSVFNLLNIFLEPIDNEGYTWDSIGVFKINANLDKFVDIENMSEEEIIDIIKNYFTKRMKYFFKTGINNYVIGDIRLMTLRRTHE